MVHSWVEGLEGSPKRQSYEAWCHEACTFFLARAHDSPVILIFVLRDQAVGKQRGCGGGLDVDSCTCEEGSVSALRVSTVSVLQRQPWALCTEMEGEAQKRRLKT